MNIYVFILEKMFGRNLSNQLKSRISINFSTLPKVQHEDIQPSYSGTFSQVKIEVKILQLIFLNFNFRVQI